MLARAARAMPLLGRELVELAARKRTYVLRVLYASGLFVIVGLVLQEMLRYGGDSYLNLMGSGRQIFSAIIGVQLAGIYLFLPAMMSVAIAQEKERDSLELLLLTDLGAWGVITQKFLGRLVPMFTFLLLSLPVMAVAFTFGGVEMQSLYIWTWALLLTMIHVGAVALAASAFCRSTASAFITSYVALGLVYAVPFIALAIYAIVVDLLNVTDFRPRHFENVIAVLTPALMFESLPDMYRDTSTWLYRSTGDNWSGWRAAVAWAPGSLMPSLEGGNAPAVRMWVSWGYAVIVTSLGGFVCAAVAMLLARRWLVTRANVPSSSLVMTVFRAVDTVMNKSNKVTGGVVLIKDRATLPGDRPVAWLETAKRPTGKARYLIRLLVLTMIPVLFVASAVVIFRGGGSQSEPLAAVLMLTWVIVVMLLLVQGASAVSSERRRQTLNVLLASPMSGSQILKEKMAPSWRMIAVLLVPFLTVIGTETWWEYGLEKTGAAKWGNITPTWLYVVCSALSLLIYLPMVAYLGLFIGLLIRSQVRAIMAALGIMSIWLVGPGFLYLVIGGFFDVDMPALLLASPGQIVIINESSDWNSYISSIVGNYYGPSRAAWWLLTALNFAIYGGIALLIRYVCMRNADRLLGRT